MSLTRLRKMTNVLFLWISSRSPSASRQLLLTGPSLIQTFLLWTLRVPLVKNSLLSHSSFFLKGMARSFQEKSSETIHPILDSSTGIISNVSSSIFEALLLVGCLVIWKTCDGPVTRAKISFWTKLPQMTDGDCGFRPAQPSTEEAPVSTSTTSSSCSSFACYSGSMQTRLSFDTWVIPRSHLDLSRWRLALVVRGLLNFEPPPARYQEPPGSPHLSCFPYHSLHPHHDESNFAIRYSTLRTCQVSSRNFDLTGEI